MRKKKIRYSEFVSPAVAAPPAAPPAVAPPVAEVVAPVAAPVAAPVVTPVAASAAAPVVDSPVAAAAALRRLTPARGSMTISRPTPRSAFQAVPRPMVARQTIAIQASRNLRERVRLRLGMLDLLTFRVGEELFGVELAAVEEAVDLTLVRHIPQMPPAMLGVVTVRGSLTPVYSPAAALGLPPTTGGSALIFRRGASRLALAVDDVDDVHTLDLAQLRDAPGVDTTDGVLLGVLRHRDSLLALVDAESLITACQAVAVLETA